MWVYDLELWPCTSPRSSILRVLVLCQSTKCKFWWYYDSLFSSYGPLSQHGSDWSRDLAILTFDLGGHGACSWCGSLSSIRIPSLKFVGLAIRKTWRTMMCVSINGPGDLDLWPFDIETGVRVASEVGNLSSKFGNARPLGSRIIRYVRDGRTDRRTKDTRTTPFPTSGGIITSMPLESLITNDAIR